SSLITRQAFVARSSNLLLCNQIHSCAFRSSQDEVVATTSFDLAWGAVSVAGAAKGASIDLHLTRTKTRGAAVGPNDAAQPISVEQVRASIRQSGWSEVTYHLGLQFVTEELRRRFGRRVPAIHEIRYALEAIRAAFQTPPGMSFEVS